MKKTSRILSLMLVCAMMISVLASCAEDKTKTPTETQQTAAVADTTTVEETTSPFVDDQLPEDLDFEDAEVGIFCWESWDKHEFFVEEDRGDIVDSAVYARNLAVEERLGVVLNWDEHPRSDAAYGSDLKKAVQQQNSAGDGTYDIVACYAQRVASCATAGELMNLRDGTYINLDNPWYYKSATLAGTLHNGYTYMTAGDLSYNALARMSGIFFNADMIENNGMEDPYDIVLEGKWTIDKMHEMISDMFVDLDGNGEPSAKDQYGLMVANDQIQTLYYGTGSHFIDHDENGNPKISDDLSSEKTQIILEKYLSLLNETAAYRIKSTDRPEDFDEGRILFYVYPLGHVADESMRNSEITYGFIPQPKVDEDEPDYHASVTNAVTVFGIPYVIDSIERASALLECLGSEGYRQVSPIVFEQAYKVKYNYDESPRQATIFDMLRANAVFDLGKICGSETFGNMANGVIGDMLWNKQSNLASQLAANSRLWTKAIEKLTKNLHIDD